MNKIWNKPDAKQPIVNWIKKDKILGFALLTECKCT